MGIALENEFSALIKRTLESKLILQVRTQREGAFYELGNMLSSHVRYGNSLTLDCLASRSMKNKYLLFINHLACGILLRQPKAKEEQNKMQILKTKQKP